MKRFVDLRKTDVNIDYVYDEEFQLGSQTGPFAWFNTGTDTFETHSGEQVWDTWEEFEEAYEGDELHRYRSLVPPGLPNGVTPFMIPPAAYRCPRCGVTQEKVIPDEEVCDHCSDQSVGGICGLMRDARGNPIKDDLVNWVDATTICRRDHGHKGACDYESV